MNRAERRQSSARAKACRPVSMVRNPREVAILMNYGPAMAAAFILGKYYRAGPTDNDESKQLAETLNACDALRAMEILPDPIGDVEMDVRKTYVKTDP